MAKRRVESGAQAAPTTSTRATALAIFAAALLSRLLFWQATPDRAWGWTAYFQGDAPLWLDYAAAIDSGRPFELGLPIHPPGAAWLVALLWNGLPSGIPFLRFSWVLLGALVPVLVFLAADRSFGRPAATIAGAWCALSTGLLVLSTSINNETPYLVLAVASFLFIEGLLEKPERGRLLGWSVLSALACLFRVEHVLFYVPALAFFGVVWARRHGWRAARWAAASVLFFAVVLLPWHLSAWSAIARFNVEPRRLSPAEENAVSQVEAATRAFPWRPGALERRDELPAFLRRTATAFVLATLAHRGRREIRSEDFDILEEAFGYFPRPLAARPFVSSYGPLNFYLANNARATGGFDRSPLADPPPLAGGAGAYPAALVTGLPPGDLSFVYPPHLRLFNDGGALGWRWIRENPGDFTRLAARKLATFWSGAATGFTGWNIPPGLSGRRAPVDMVAAGDRPVAIAWRVAVLLACVAGVVVGIRKTALAPWLLFVVGKVAVTALFFGYARAGAVVAPVVAVLVGVAIARFVPSRRSTGLVVVVLAAGVALEAARLVSRPTISIDGAPVTAEDPPAADDHSAHRIDVE